MQIPKVFDVCLPLGTSSCLNFLHTILLVSLCVGSNAVSFFNNFRYAILFLYENTPSQSINGVKAITPISEKRELAVECAGATLTNSAIMEIITKTLIGIVCRKKTAEKAEKIFSFFRFLIFISRISDSVILLFPILTQSANLIAEICGELEVEAAGSVLHFGGQLFDHCLAVAL